MTGSLKVFSGATDHAGVNAMSRTRTLFRMGHILLILSGLSGAQTTCERPSLVENGRVWRAGNAIVFQTQGLSVDADGAPNSYLVDGKGLSYTCDGVVAIVNGKKVTPESDPAHWQSICAHAWSDAVANGDYSRVAIFGFLTDGHNHPVVQQAPDPLPGKAYISTTTLTIPGTLDRTQRHWVDATQVPYIVLTSSFTKTNQVEAGDLAVVFRPKTGAVAFAVYADLGPNLGEASVRLHRDLGNEPITRPPSIPRAKLGISDLAVTLVFPGVNVSGESDLNAWNRAITEIGHKTLDGWGGIARLNTCVP